MRHFIILMLITVSLSSCKSSKTIVTKKSTSKKVISQPKTDASSTSRVLATKKRKENDLDGNAPKEVSKALSIVDYAKQFSGVKYRFGGTTTEGMDCSGLVFESFRAFNVILPRISRDMAKLGDKITLKDTQEGDLLFFKTMNRRNDISHVGLVVTTENGDIQFIHATTRAGVIVSNLSETYWDNAFVEARRML